MPELKRPCDVFEETIRRYGLTQESAATALNVSRLTVNMICRGRRIITAEMAVRLEIVFEGRPAEEWLALQAQEDLATVRMDIGYRGGLRRRRLPTGAS